MRQKTGFITLRQVFAVTCVASMGASMGWVAGKWAIELEYKAVKAGLNLVSDQLKKLTTKAEKKEEQ